MMAHQVTFTGNHPIHTHFRVFQFFSCQSKIQPKRHLSLAEDSRRLEKREKANEKAFFFQKFTLSTSIQYCFEKTPKRKHDDQSRVTIHRPATDCSCCGSVFHRMSCGPRNSKAWIPSRRYLDDWVFGRNEDPCSGSMWTYGLLR